MCQISNLGLSHGCDVMSFLFCAYQEGSFTTDIFHSTTIYIRNAACTFRSHLS